MKQKDTVIKHEFTKNLTTQGKDLAATLYLVGFSE